MCIWAEIVIAAGTIIVAICNIINISKVSKLVIETSDKIKKHFAEKSNRDTTVNMENLESNARLGSTGTRDDVTSKNSTDARAVHDTKPKSEKKNARKSSTPHKRT